jgi:hypothetical protein
VYTSWSRTIIIGFHTQSAQCLADIVRCSAWLERGVWRKSILTHPCTAHWRFAVKKTHHGLLQCYAIGWTLMLLLQSSFNPLNLANHFCVFQVPLSINNRWNWRFSWCFCHDPDSYLKLLRRFLNTGDRAHKYIKLFVRNRGVLKFCISLQEWRSRCGKYVFYGFFAENVGWTNLTDSYRFIHYVQGPPR